MGAMQQSLLLTAAAVANTLDTPIFHSAGAFVSGIAAITVTPPTSYINNDLLVLVITSTNQTIATPSGWTQVSNSPQGTGTAGASQSIACAIFTKLASGAQADVSVTDSGVLNIGQMFCFRKVNQTTSVEVTAGSVLATAGTTHTLPAVTTSTNNALIAHYAGIGRDADSFNNYTSPTNANLTGLTVQQARTISTANGGGIGLVTGTKTTSGSTGTTSVTVGAAAKGAFITLGIMPSTNYDTAVRVTGGSVFGGGFSASDIAYDSGSSTAFATLNSDGTVTISGNNGAQARATWLSNSSSGSSYWVRATTVTNIGTGSITGTTGSWLQLNTNRTWQADAVSGQTKTWQIKLEYSTDSGGTTIVATEILSLVAESNVGPPP